MNKFTVRMFHYLGGQLQIIEKEFEHVADAIEHGLNSLAHSFKVFGEDGCCHHDSQGDNNPYC